MQLPPTILSLDNHKKKKKDPVVTKATGKKAATTKAKSGPKGKPIVPDSAPVQPPQDEDHKANSSDESNQEGDTVMRDDDDIPTALEDANAGTSASRGTNPPAVKALRRGALEPPRTLETTLFDRLEKMYGPGIKRLLNVQYRCRTYFSKLPVALIVLDSQDEPEDC